MTPRIAATALLSAAVLLAPAAAQGATKTVTMGVPPASQKAFPAGTDVNAFFPATTTIRTGDKVRFVPVGFHDAYLPKKGDSRNQPFIAPSGPPIAGATDPAGAAYWFNGLPSFASNPAVVFGALGKTVSYSGAKAVESGLPLAAKPKPMTVKFTRAGTFTYLCNVHPGMRGTVRVLSHHHRAPKASVEVKAVKKQVAQALAIAKGLPKKAQPAGTFDVGEAGAHGVEYFGFLPATMSVAAGSPVTFRMTPGSLELHTATTGPGNPESEPDSFLGKLGASITSPAIDPAALYPSDAPGTPVAVSPTSHGNGFWNSGGMDVDARTPSPSSTTVTFSTPGTYQVYCLIHPFMHGTVDVR